MRRRFFRGAALAISVGLTVGFLFSFLLISPVFDKEADERLNISLALVKSYPLPSQSEIPYAELARRMGEDIRQTGEDLRITVVGEDGRVLGDSEASPDSMANHAHRPEIRQALETGMGRDVRRSRTTGVRQIYRAVLVTQLDGSRVVYRASLSLQGVQGARRVLWGSLAAGALAGLITALLAAAYLEGRVVRSLRELTQAAQRIEKGESPLPVEDAPDEIGQLSNAFNRMSERLADARVALEQSNQRMAGILQGMDDGVLAVDSEGQILLLTRRAQELLGEIPPAAVRLEEGGAHYLHIQSLLDRVCENGEPVRDTIVLSSATERIINVYAAPVSDCGSTLAVLSDVTRIRQLETMRSEFVANVTHELKTPLTSIRGYVELLRSQPREEQTAQSFYEIIEIEAERLQTLTEDLLQLSEIEGGAREDDSVQTASVKETAERIAESLRPQAEGNGITLTVDVPADLWVRTAPHRLHQLLQNLMENAVKYNRSQGRVDVTAGVERGVAVLRVKDTGIGIPPAHIDRIFERFYRVDKGRSREQGGTGLGLSIVKHIAGLYGGDVRAESTGGEGSTFTVRLPRA